MARPHVTRETMDRDVDMAYPYYGDWTIDAARLVAEWRKNDLEFDFKEEMSKYRIVRRRAQLEQLDELPIG